MKRAIFLKRRRRWSCSKGLVNQMALVKCHMKRCAHKIGRVHLCHDLICQPDDVAGLLGCSGLRQIIDNITRLPLHIRRFNEKIFMNLIKKNSACFFLYKNLKLHKSGQQNSLTSTQNGPFSILHIECLKHSKNY